MRIGIDIRVADPADPGQQRYLWRLGAWLAESGHETHFLSVKRQAPGVEAPSGAELHALSRAQLTMAISDLELDALLLNPERSRAYRGIRANVLRAAYGTDHYSQKLRSFRRPAERALRGVWRKAPWALAEARWERGFYEDTQPPPHVIAQSAYMRAQILESYEVPEDHVHVIHNAVDTSEFSLERRLALRDEMRARWSIPDGVFCLLFLGHNYRLKGLWQLLQVLGRLRGEGIHLLVAGSGTGAGQRKKAERLIRATGLEAAVTIAGSVRPSLHALAAADALVHLSWHDSFGFAVLEAMASGLPVVTTPYAGASELIEKGVSGLVVDPADDDDVLAAVRILLDPELRDRMSRAAAAIGGAQDEPSNFVRVLEVIERAAVERGKPVR
ncbi:MAG: glycosyltransferase family 4 protein [Gemmatimonadota bacterium]|nr:glycosyltransferase family 4 protein [Gemmatimonadota bacterium]